MSRSPILSDVSLIPLSPQPLAGMTGMNQFNPDLYMSGFSSPTMSMLSQARNLSPRHSIQGRSNYFVAQLVFEVFYIMYWLVQSSHFYRMLGRKKLGFYIFCFLKSRKATLK